MVNHGLFALALAGLSAFAAAQPHGRQHRHRDVHARDLVIETQTVVVDQNGNTITGPAAAAASSPAETVVKIDNFVAPGVTTAVTTVAPAPSSSSQPAASTLATLATLATPATFATSTVAPSSKTTYSAPAATSSQSSSNSGTGKQTGGSGLDSDFPDGELSCDTFPSQYGAVPLTWISPAGWSGVQQNGGSAGDCEDGALCSYACPPGYSKAQWPADQPSSGESHGGLLCQGGKLHLTRPDYPKLCQAGVGSASVENNLGQEVAVCRTDYPGTESMVVPLDCSPGSTVTLTVPAASNSYTWRGKSTSAQYYVNPKGVSVQDGCTWGADSGNIGNWAPIVSFFHAAIS